MKIATSSIAASTPLNLTIQPLWDTVQCATNQSQPLSFFTVAIGGTKTLRDTNMRQAGGLPSPNEFYMRGLALFPCPRPLSSNVPATTDITDLQQLLENGVVQFYIGTNGRKLCEVHGHVLPAGFGVDGMIATGGATSSNVAHIIGNGQRRLDNKYGFADYAEKLNSTESFNAQIIFPTGSVSMTNSISIRIYLSGILGQSIG